MGRNEHDTALPRSGNDYSDQRLTLLLLALSRAISHSPSLCGLSVCAVHPAAPVSSLALSHDSNCLLLSCLDSSYRLLDVASGEVLNEYSGAVAQHFRMEGAFDNSDGFVAAGSEDGSVIVWDLVEVSLQGCTEARAHHQGDCFPVVSGRTRCTLRSPARNFITLSVLSLLAHST